MYKCQIETMLTVFLNKKRVKILKNSGESNYTPIHILQKKKKVPVHLMYTNEYVSGFFLKNHHLYINYLL